MTKAEDWVPGASGPLPDGGGGDGTVAGIGIPLRVLRAVRRIGAGRRFCPGRQTGDRRGLPIPRRRGFRGVSFGPAEPLAGKHGTHRGAVLDFAGRGAAAVAAAVGSRGGRYSFPSPRTAPNSRRLGM